MSEATLNQDAIIASAKRLGMTEAADLLIDLGHTNAAQVLIDRLNAERIAAFADRNEALTSARE